MMVARTTHSSSSTQTQANHDRLYVLRSFASSSTSVACATFLTNFIDVVKVRQQLAGARSASMARTFLAILDQEGVLALNKGVVPATARGMLYGGMRIGMYGPAKDALAGDAPAGLGTKVAAGMASGSVAAAVCNPTDIIKTRMQAGAARLSISEAVREVVGPERQLRRLWNGTTPSMARAALLTAAQCATYDEVKQYFTRTLGWDDTIPTHLAVSGVAGLVTTTAIAPADVVKTRMFMADGGGKGMGVAATLRSLYAEQGVRGLFKGWGANWARQGPMTTVVFVVSEAVRPLFGLDAL
jgi:solute carrier family 25 uncoupling protein 8/9